MSQMSRRHALKLGVAAAAAGAVGLPGAASAAIAYKFVRIEGLAEQAVGEKILMDVYKRAGIEISISPMPGRRALEMASTGAIDGETLRVYGLGENVKSLIRVPTPLSSLQTVAFAKKDKAVSLTSREDLNNYSSVIVTGVLHTHAITEGISNVREMTDPAGMFKMVEAGRADLALTSYLDGLASLKKLKIDSIVNVEPALNDQPLYHYVHESKKDVIDTIEPIIKEMSASGELASMRKSMEDAYLASL